MTIRSIRSIILVLAVLVAGLSSQTIAAEVQNLEIQLASAYESGHIVVQVSERFKELVEERSEGRIQVNVFPGGVMGGEEDITEAVTVGAVEMQAGGGIPIYLFAPGYYFVDTPFIIQDWDHFQRVWYGPIGDDLRETVARNGDIAFLGLIYRGMRQFTSNRPVTTPADARGLKLRLPVLDSWIRVWEQIGASPVPVPLHELYTALATGVADASEGDMEQIWSFKLHEVQSHLSLTGHHVQTGYLTISNSFLNSLNEPTRELIVAAAREASEWGTEIVLNREQELIERMRAAGMIVQEADAAAFREAGTPAVEQLFETQFNVTTWDEVLAQ